MGVQTLRQKIVEAIMFGNITGLADYDVSDVPNMDLVMQAIADRDTELIAELEKLKVEDIDKYSALVNQTIDAAIQAIKERSEV